MFAYCRNNPVCRKDASGTADVDCFGDDELYSSADLEDRGGGGGGMSLGVHSYYVSGVTQFSNGGNGTGSMIGNMSYVNKKATNSTYVPTYTWGDFFRWLFGNQSSQCFVAGTLVQTADGMIEIENITVGDLVWAWDEETGEVALKEVVETYVNETSELVHVFVNGEEIICTPSHPFYSPIKGWTDAVKLRAGDILVLVNGEYVVVEKIQHEILETPVTVYNFQVEDYHTYYVADSGVLVHNSCFDPKTNSTKAVKLSNGSKAYLQNSGEYAGQFIAKDFAGHGNSAFKLFDQVGNKYLQLIGDIAADGSRIYAKHSSNAGKVYEIVKWITVK